MSRLATGDSVVLVGSFHELTFSTLRPLSLSICLSVCPSVRPSVRLSCQVRLVVERSGAFLGGDGAVAAGQLLKVFWGLIFPPDANARPRFDTIAYIATTASMASSSVPMRASESMMLALPSERELALDARPIPPAMIFCCSAASSAGGLVAMSSDDSTDASIAEEDGERWSECGESDAEDWTSSSFCREKRNINFESCLEVIQK